MTRVTASLIFPGVGWKPRGRSSAADEALQLLRDHQVQYAGYQLPHPLEHRMLIKVQTTGQTAAPVDVLKAAIVDLQGETEALDRGFRDGVAAVRERQMQI